MPTYSYNPEQIKQNGMDRLRFELGDTKFSPAELTAALSDEEYNAVLEMNKSWKRAKLAALEAILMKFAHSCDTRVGPLSYSFSDRVEKWRQLYEELKSKYNTSAPPLSSAYEKNSQPYFYEDMHCNDWKG